MLLSVLITNYWHSNYNILSSSLRCSANSIPTICYFSIYESAGMPNPSLCAEWISIIILFISFSGHFSIYKLIFFYQFLEHTDMQHENNMICYDNLLKLKYRLMGGVWIQFELVLLMWVFKGCCAGLIPTTCD